MHHTRPHARPGAAARRWRSKARLHRDELLGVPHFEAAETGARHLYMVDKVCPPAAALSSHGALMSGC